MSELKNILFKLVDLISDLSENHPEEVYLKAEVKRILVGIDKLNS